MGFRLGLALHLKFNKEFAIIGDWLAIAVVLTCVRVSCSLADRRSSHALWGKFRDSRRASQTDLPNCFHMFRHQSLSHAIYNYIYWHLISFNFLTLINLLIGYNKKLLLNYLLHWHEYRFLGQNIYWKF